jgi:hypothetical protein
MVFNLFKNKINIITFLASLIIGFVLWYFAKTNEVVLIEKKLKVQVRTAKTLIVKNVSSDSIEVEIRAKKRQLNILNLKSFSPVINLPYDIPGVFKIKLQESSLSFPALLGIEDYEIKSPDSLQIELDSLIRTKVSITSVRGMTFEPDKVTIVGPKSIVSNIEYLSPDSIPKGPFTTITIENPLIEVFPRKIRVRQ